MRNFLKNAGEKTSGIVAMVGKIATKCKLRLAVYKTNAKTVLYCQKGENYVDSGIKILIAVVIGALLLAGLYALFGDVIMPELTARIEEMFDYAG